MIAEIENLLGFEIPPAYVELCQTQNGGVPNRKWFTFDRVDRKSDGFITINGIFAIGTKGRCSLGGELNTKFWIEEWGYPPIGIYFADCPSGVHDLIALDYRDNGPNGEPSVVHVDEYDNYRITQLAPNFELFIRNLEFEPDDNSKVGKQ